MDSPVTLTVSNRRLILLIRDIYMFTLEQYKANRIGTQMLSLSQRYSKRYRSIVGPELAESAPLYSFIHSFSIDPRRTQSAKVLLYEAKNRKGTSHFVPIQVMRMHASYSMNPERFTEHYGKSKRLSPLDDFVCCLALQDERGRRVVGQFAEGPALTDRSLDRALSEIDSFVIESLAAL